MVVVTFCIVSFGGICRFGELAAAKSEDLSFGPGDNSVTVHFSKRKNDKYRHGSKVSIVASGHDLVCPIRLVRTLLTFSSAWAASFLFQGFGGKLVRRNAADTRPSGSALRFSQYRRYLSLWFGSVLDFSPEEFLRQYGTHSGRIGGASAAANAGVAIERWGQHDS